MGQLIQDFTLPQILTLQWFMNISRYFIVVGGSYLLFWKYLKPKFLFPTHKKTPHKKKDIQREIRYSLQTLTIFLIPTFLIIYFSDSGIFRTYFDISNMSLTWYFFSYLVVFFIHDTYFYWTHRLMHHPKLYKKFHAIHHKSIYPTPFAAFSFNATEALVESFVFVLISLVIPVHVSVLVLFTLYSLVMNVYGHMGMDLLPKKVEEAGLLKYFNHPKHHAWHHRHFNGNYGFYLKFWDKLMGTYKGGLNGDR